jgi:hypothetical protein
LQTCGSSSKEEKGAKRKGKLESGAAACHDEVEVWRARVRQQFPTDEAPASITEHYGFLYARVSISFTTVFTPDAPSRIPAGRDKRSSSNSSSFARVLEVEHSHLVEASSSSASSIVAHRHPPRPKHVRAQQTDIQADGAAHSSAAHPLHRTSHLSRCMGL